MAKKKGCSSLTRSSRAPQCACKLVPACKLQSACWRTSLVSLRLGGPTTLPLVKVPSFHSRYRKPFGLPPFPIRPHAVYPFLQPPGSRQSVPRGIQPLFEDNCSLNAWVS